MRADTPSISARLCDITTLAVDAIVNAANEELLVGGGVCGAIFRAAGPGLGPACKALGRCLTGQARITPGFALPARYIIHAVGPIWRGGTEGEADLLAYAYRASLNLAKKHGLRSMAFPAISTGVFGFPLTAATRIAVRTVREELADLSTVDQVIFSCYDEQTLEAYRAVGVEVS